MAVFSPLRYPGGKAKFAKLIQQCMSEHVNSETIFVEPFCGGAGVALTLLCTGAVKKIALNDLDPLVSSFWQVVFGKSEKSDKGKQADFTWLLNQIDSANLTVNGWLEQKELQPTSVRAAAFKCLFLNRTSFNGILHQAGPIGGWGQINRTLGVRFNQSEIKRRLIKLWDLRECVVECTNNSWQSVLSSYREKSCFIYLDPPYYHRAEQLYKFLFDEDLHAEMRDTLASERKIPWLLSYDDSVEIRKLYGSLEGIDGLVIDKTYSAHPLGGGRFLGRELFFSNKQLKIASRNGAVEHSAVSVVGSLKGTASTSEGPVRLPLFGDVDQRRRGMHQIPA